MSCRNESRRGRADCMGVYNGMWLARGLRTTAISDRVFYADFSCHQSRTGKLPSPIPYRLSVVCYFHWTHTSVFMDAPPSPRAIFQCDMAVLMPSEHRLPCFELYERRAPYSLNSYGVSKSRSSFGYSAHKGNSSSSLCFEIRYGSPAVFSLTLAVVLLGSMPLTNLLTRLQAQC